MNSVINFIEFENHTVSASYVNLMQGAMVVLVNAASGDQLPEPVVRINSPAPNGSLRIKIPPSFAPGAYFLRALNGHGVDVARSVVFRIG